MVDADLPEFTTVGDAAVRLLDNLDRLSRCPVTGVDTRHANAPALVVPYQDRRPAIYASLSVAPGDDEAYVIPLVKQMKSAHFLRIALFFAERKVISMEQLAFTLRWLIANFGDAEARADFDPRDEVAR